MSRIRKVTAIAAFAYAQYALAIASGIVLVPLTLRYLGARSWGIWLASGEVLNYAAMVDLGMLGVLPWLLAGAEGGSDHSRARRLMSQGVWLGLAVGVLYAAAAGLLWWLLPSFLPVSESDRALIGPPLLLVVGLGVLTYPLSVFRAALVGTQDVTFNGVVAIAGSGLTIMITAVMLMTGYGLMALACASAVPRFLITGASACRLYATRPDLRPRWEPPRQSDLQLLFNDGIGVWMGGLGWQLLSASNGIVMTYMGHLEWVVIYSCTAKLSSSFMQLAWVVPDSGEVSLAQLHGESPSAARLRDVVLMILRLHLLLAGGVALGVLAFNPAFVSSWVGSTMFGGTTLNVLLALGVVFYSLIHGLMTSAAVLGNRPRVGVAVLVNGVIQLALALLLGEQFGLVGIACAGLAAGAVTSLPAGFVLLKPSTAISMRDVLTGGLNPWMMRFAPIAVVAAISGALGDALGVWRSAVLTAVLGGVYVWVMRPLYDSLPVDPRLARWLVRLRLLKPVDRPAAGIEAL